YRRGDLPRRPAGPGGRAFRSGEGWPMNARQKAVVRLGLAAMVVMALVPPWQVTRYHMPWEVQGDDGRQVTVTYQYRFVADPPEAGTLRVRAVAFGWSRLRYQY